MAQFVGAVEGMAEACEALGYPVVSGNVSLYNETNGVAIPPTPAIGGVGVIEDVTKAGASAARSGDRFTCASFSASRKEPRRGRRA